MIIAPRSKSNHWCQNGIAKAMAFGLLECQRVKSSNVVPTIRCHLGTNSNHEHWFNLKSKPLGSTHLMIQFKSNGLGEVGEMTLPFFDINIWQLVDLDFVKKNAKLWQ